MTAQVVLEAEKPVFEFSEVDLPVVPVGDETPLLSYDLDGDGVDSLVWIDMEREVRAVDIVAAAAVRSLGKLPVECTSDCRAAKGHLDGDDQLDLAIVSTRSRALYAFRLSTAANSESKLIGTLPGSFLGFAGKDPSGRGRLFANLPHGVAALTIDSSLSLELQTPLARNLPIAPPHPQLVRIFTWPEYAVIWSGTTAGRRGWFGMELYFEGQLIRIAEFQPQEFDWHTNFALGDLNGDALDELLVHARESRTLWAGISVGEGLVESSIAANIDAAPGWQNLVIGEFTGDGIGDVLLYDGEAKRWLLGRSLLAVPAEGIELVLSSGQTAITGELGKICRPEISEISAPRDKYDVAFGKQLASEDARYRVARFARDNRGTLRVLLQRNGPVKGQRFAIGRTVAPPYLCVGYMPQSAETKWGGAQSGACPKDYAYFAAEDQSAGKPLVELLPYRPCCPLPADDMLHGRAVETLSTCPDGYIVVGVQRRTPRGEYPLLCVPINKTRYKLGPRRPGIYWGFGFSARWAGASLRRDELPLGLMHGAMRIGFNERDLDGCVGEPPGSLLVGRVEGERSCARFVFQQVLYNGRPGDPPAGTPLQMLPDCSSVSGLFTPFARCDN